MAKLIRDMGTVIAAIIIGSIVGFLSGVLGSILAPVVASGLRLIRRWAVAEMRGYVLVLALVNLILANAIVWFVIAQGWP